MIFFQIYSLSFPLLMGFSIKKRDLYAFFTPENFLIFLKTELEIVFSGSIYSLHLLILCFSLYFNLNFFENIFIFQYNSYKNKKY